MKLFILGLFTVGFILSSSLAYAGVGHDAGWKWAEKHGITDTSYNRGNSASFNEGVRQYAEANQ